MANLLRGTTSGAVIAKRLSVTVLRRLDCALEPSKVAVLAEKQLREGHGLDPEPLPAGGVAVKAFCDTSALPSIVCECIAPIDLHP